MILTLKDTLDYKVDMSPVTPTSCTNSSSQPKKITLQTSQGQCSLADLFTVSPEKPEQLIIRNSTAMLNNLGASLDEGEMIIEGDVGDWLAYQMSGGQLTITGAVGHYAASAMSGGMLSINGNVGDSLGGTMPGNRYGMHGGTVIVQGNVGDKLGDRLRNGLLIVKGNAGDYCAARIIAGSIVVTKKVGAYPAFGMQRGSLFLSHPNEEILSDFFTVPRYCEVSFLPMFLKHLQKTDPDFKCWPISRYAHRCIGDRSVNGYGEIFFI